MRFRDLISCAKDQGYMVQDDKENSIISLSKGGHIFTATHDHMTYCTGEHFCIDPAGSCTYTWRIRTVKQAAALLGIKEQA